MDADRPSTAAVGGRSLVYGEAGGLLVREAVWARGPLGRMRGLLGRRALGEGHALVLAPCRSIHTAGMRFPLDLVFFARDGCVVARRAGVRPWRLAWGGRRAWGVLEMHSGWFPWPRLRADDRLVFAPADGLPFPVAAQPPDPVADPVPTPPPQAMCPHEAS